MEITGQITAVLPERSGVGQKGEWKSQDFVVSMISGRYVSIAVVSVWGADNLALFNIKQGENLTICFDFDGRESKDGSTWYNSLRVYDVIRNGVSVRQSASSQQIQQQVAQQQVQQPQGYQQPQQPQYQQ